MPELSPTRRAVLAGLAALPAVPLLPRAARAEEQVVVGCWGGDYAHLLHDNVDDPFLKPAGITVVQDVGDEDPRVAKMRLQARLPHGAIDVACLQAVRAHEVGAAGLLETIDATKVPNLAHVLPNLKSATYVPHIWSPQVLVYNPDRVATPPMTFTDLLDPKYKGKVGVGDGNYMYVMMAAALATTGDCNKVDADATRDLVVRLRGNGLRLYSSTDAIGAGIKSGEIDVGMIWLARTAMWQNAGIPVKPSFPKEGPVLYISGMVVPKNAPDKAAAYKYLDAMLEPGAQQAFAAKMGYIPTVNDAPLAGKVAQQLALPTPSPTLAVPDYDIVGKLAAPTAEWWKKTMQA